MVAMLLIAMFVAGMAIAMWLSKKARASILMGGIAFLFLPFGVLVAIGWMVPKVLQVVLPYLPLKDVIS